MHSLLPGENFFKSSELAPLANLLDIDSKNKKFTKYAVAKRFIEQKLSTSDAKEDKPFEIVRIAEILYPFRRGFISVYKLYVGAMTFGANSAACVASFSTLSRVLTLYSVL